MNTYISAYLTREEDIFSVDIKFALVKVYANNKKEALGEMYKLISKENPNCSIKIHDDILEFEGILKEK